ncbi:MAG TPA: flagellar basal body rod protein FlgB [Xanthobacteraceae bacterium]|nr:flagellar basal body rod protein FlgB [Xanthobacteraceae bacterium]
MPISNIPLFSMLRARMHWHQERQQVLATNVVNADMPNYRPRDLVPPRVGGGAEAGGGPLGLARTSPAHMTLISGSASSQFQATQSGYDVRPSGNAVDLTDEMMKLAANQMDYQAATMLYSKSLNLLKTALGKR